ncbi:MAG: polysaccharide deacetylase family protein [Candidatus Sumerlaeaceae bacterium]|nr:polysaccharide deacetylase family protein [Candidatus Sumerlaeaceae bacterium]
MDLDNLWALAECYGFDVEPAQGNFLYSDAFPRLRALLDDVGVPATFFALGRDARDQNNRRQLAAVAAAGHALANHSDSHSLDFRHLNEAALEREVALAEQSLADIVGKPPVGFRAPGYGRSPGLLRVLVRRGYRYDSSLMPSPFGPVLRLLDWRLRRRTPRGRVIRKAQFPRVSDTWNPRAPHPVRMPDGGSILEIPTAVSPLLRLPFQASVCMILGRAYFEVNLAASIARRVPFVFLMHLADIADFRALDHPFFRGNTFFEGSAAAKTATLRHFLERLASTCRVLLTEDWLGQFEPPPDSPPVP